MTSLIFEAICERATQHTEAGRWGEARSAWHEALALSPGSAELMLELSYVASFAGHYREGREWTLRAAQAGPQSVDGVLSLVHRLRTFNEVPRLRRLVIFLL